MTKLKSKIGLLILLPALFSFLPRFFSVDDLIVKLEDYLAYYTPEKVYLHLDKPYYSAGDTLWFSTYLTHGVSHMATAPSKLVYVELVNADRSILAKRDIHIEDGVGAGEISLPDTLSSGAYIIRSYTSFMRNFDQDFFYQKEIQIQNTARPSFSEVDIADTYKGDFRNEEMATYSDLIRLRFFPEGGDLVNGVWSTVGFKAEGPDGRGVEVAGEVTDSKGSKIADLKTNSLGMGKFLMHPVVGDSYSASFKLGIQKLQVPLPVAKASGFVMSMTNVSPKFLTLKVQHSADQSLDGGVVVGHVRGVVFITLKAVAGQPFQALIPKEDLPEGIAHFTFFDGQGRPQAERLVFIAQEAKRPVVQLHGLEAGYAKRSKVSMDVTVGEGAPVKSSLSVAVVDKMKVQHDSDDWNFVSYLLLCSDIKGKIESPGYYFDKGNKDRQEALDNLMLTQGWRRFTWKDLMEEKKPDINFLVEPGFSIAGRVTDFLFQERPYKGLVTITGTEADGDIWSNETESDEDGYFLFTSLDIDDSARVVIQTPHEKKISRRGGKKEFYEEGGVNASVKIQVTEQTSPEVNYGFKSIDDLYNAKAIAEYLEEVKKVKEIEAAFGSQEVVVLDEIEVESRRKMDGERFNKPGMTYRQPLWRLDADSLSKSSQYLSIFEMFMGTTPGVRVVGTFPNYNMVLRGAANITGGNVYPLYLLNGSIVDAAIINTLPVQRVDFVDILRGTGATMYGTQGAGGIVAVYLKDGDQLAADYVPRGVIGVSHAGFYHARQFYSPDYSTQKESHLRTDVRPTLYWKAGLKTTEGAPAQLEFYTSDVASTFEIRIEGITEDGRPFVKTEEIVVN